MRRKETKETKAQNASKKRNASRGQFQGYSTFSIKQLWRAGKTSIRGQADIGSDSSTFSQDSFLKRQVGSKGICLC